MASEFAHNNFQGFGVVKLRFSGESRPNPNSVTKIYIMQVPGGGIESFVVREANRSCSCVYLCVEDKFASEDFSEESGV